MGTVGKRWARSSESMAEDYLGCPENEWRQMSQPIPEAINDLKRTIVSQLLKCMGPSGPAQ